MEKEQIKAKPLWLKLFIALAVIVFLFLILRLVSSKIGPEKNNDGGLAQQKKVSKNCTENPAPIFTADFTDTNKLNFIAPIGGIMVGSPARSYIFVKGSESLTGSRIMVPIHAPADAVLEGIVYARRNPNDPNAPGEYRLDFRVSCEVTFHFDHLDDIADSFKKSAPKEPLDRTNEATKVNIQVKAGDLLAYTDGTTAAGSFDFYLINTSKKVPHINTRRWQWEQTTVADCPYDYFEENLKTKYFGLLKSQDGANLINLSCGNPSHDIAGTASGGWFQGDSTDTNGKWLEIGNANGKVEILLRNSGNHDFNVRDYQNKIMPEDLTVSKETCYSEHGKWAYIRVDSSDKLSLGRGQGSCPSTFPSSNVETWER